MVYFVVGEKTMNEISFLIGVIAISALVTFSILAARAQQKTQEKCFKLDGCQLREMDVIERKHRAR